MKSIALFAAIVLGAGFSAASHAVPLAANTTINLNTGTDATGSVLAAGTLDPFWTISTDGTTFTAARVAYPAPSGQICCGMDTVDGSAAWISTPNVTASDPATTWGISNIVYARRSFDLTGFDLDTVSLAGELRVADSSAGLYLNGTLVPGTHANGTYTFQFDIAFSIAAGSSAFVQGINTLELRGTSVNSQWDAMYLTTTVSGVTAPVPEPETWALFFAGLGILALVRSKRA